MALNFDGSTEYEDALENVISQSFFLNLVNAGANVKVKDKLAVDGIADKVSIE